MFPRKQGASEDPVIGRFNGDHVRNVDCRCAYAADAALIPAGFVRVAEFEERRRQLFSEGHRFVDMVRKNLPFTPAAGTSNRKGQTFGPVTCIPLPDEATRNNPNFKG